MLPASIPPTLDPVQLEEEHRDLEEDLELVEEENGGTYLGLEELVLVELVALGSRPRVNLERLL